MPYAWLRFWEKIKVSENINWRSIKQTFYIIVIIDIWLHENHAFSINCSAFSFNNWLKAEKPYLKQYNF